MGLRNYILENIVDPLVVRYLKHRIDTSKYIGELAGRSLGQDCRFPGRGYRINLERYLTPAERIDGRKNFEIGEKIFEEKHSEIVGKQGPEDKFVVIDTATKKYYFGSSISQSIKNAREDGATDKKCYLLPISTKKEREEINRRAEQGSLEEKLETT